MKYNVSKLDPNYHFDIVGASYAGSPLPGTVMYIVRKVQKLLDNLSGISDCLVFIEEGMQPDPALTKNNCFIACRNPSLEYARLLKEFEKEKLAEESKYHYKLTDGYYLGENVRIGSGAFIEPGCLIGHGVVIGERCRIMAGAVIKNAVIGDDFICGENAVVGANGFTLTEDENGNLFRMPTLGKVIIGNDVEIGQLDSVSIGSGGNTVIQDHVKLDALIHIGHNDNLGKNTEMPAGVIVAGFVNTGEHTRMGVNASVRNRIDLGDYCMVGMGAVVTKSVPDHLVVAGNPAKEFVRHSSNK